jgi:hypothetical protein
MTRCPAHGNRIQQTPQKRSTRSARPLNQIVVGQQVLLEIRPRCQLGVLVSSREGMGSGVPLSTAVLEGMLAGLQASVPAAAVRFRSDRDGPVRQAAAA